MFLCRMLRTTNGVFSGSDAFALSSDPEGAHTEFACWILERSEIAATPLFRDYDDWARATDHAESPKRSIPRRRTVRKGAPKWQPKPIRSPSRQDPASNRHSLPNGERWHAALQEPVSCNGGKNIRSGFRRRNFPALIRSRF